MRLVSPVSAGVKSTCHWYAAFYDFEGLDDRY